MGRPLREPQMEGVVCDFLDFRGSSATPQRGLTAWKNRESRLLFLLELAALVIPLKYAFPFKMGIVTVVSSGWWDYRLSLLFFLPISIF